MGKSKNKINLHGAIIIVFLLLALYFVLHIFTYCKEGYNNNDNGDDNDDNVGHKNQVKYHHDLANHHRGKYEEAKQKYSNAQQNNNSQKNNKPQKKSNCHNNITYELVTGYKNDDGLKDTIPCEHYIDSKSCANAGHTHEQNQDVQRCYWAGGHYNEHEATNLNTTGFSSSATS